MQRLRTTIAALVALALPAAAQDMQSFTDDLGRTVEIPADPQRIIGLWDWFITTPLIELGAPVVGSHGRVREDGSTYIRPANVILGVDFDTSGITFTGAHQQFDFEIMAELQPDLIVARTNEQDMLTQLEAIAPVVFIDTRAPIRTYYGRIADAVGKTDQFRQRNERFDTLLEDARAWIGDAAGTYSIIQAGADGNFRIYARTGITTDILDRLGFTMVGEGVAIGESGENFAIVSPEMMPAQDADWIFGNYRIDQGALDGPAVQRQLLNDQLPEFCRFLTACSDGRMILLPREHASAPSFQAWETIVHAIVSNVAGRPGIAVPE